MPPSFMPPNGFAGLAQQTAAVQSLYSRGGARTRGGRSRSRRRSAARKVANNRRRSYASGPRSASARSNRRQISKPARMQKGSAAAKRYMAKLRRMRKR